MGIVPTIAAKEGNSVLMQDDGLRKQNKNEVCIFFVPLACTGLQ